MKTITRFWAAAAVFAGLFTACSDLDDIKNKMDEMDGRLTALAEAKICSARIFERAYISNFAGTCGSDAQPQ